MKYKNLLVLLLVNLNQSFLPAAQESKIQDEPFVVIPFEQHVDQMVEKFPGINQTFAFLQEQDLVNQSFRQFLQTKLASDEDENDNRSANSREVVGQAHEIIAANMKDQFIAALNITLNKNKTLDQFDNPIILYVMQHKDDFMHDIVHSWLLEWSETRTVNGWTPLHLAIYFNHAAIACILIDAGVDINTQNNDQRTPLHIAAERKNKKIVIMLINAHANLNIQDKYGETALYHTAFNDDSEITHILINAGLNFNIQNNDGWTPLHWAACNNCTMAAEILINAGADLTIQSARGNTAQQMASTPKMQIIFMWAQRQKALSCIIS